MAKLLLLLLLIIQLKQYCSSVPICPYDDYQLTPDPFKCLHLYSSNNTNVYSASSLCESFNGYLISIHSAFENQFIYCNYLYLYINSIFSTFSINQPICTKLIGTHRSH